MVFVSQSVHFTFRTYTAAAEALLVVMEDMRRTELSYRLIGRSPERLLSNGMTLEGEVSEVADLVSEVSGAVRDGSE